MNSTGTAAPEVLGLHLSFDRNAGQWLLKDGATVLDRADTLTAAEALFYVACDQ